MPWQTPTLRQCREYVRNDITMALRGATAYGNKVLRIMSDAMAGLAALVLKYLDWLALQLLPDTAEGEWLDRHGQIWLVNADGSKGRKMASLASGSVTATGLQGVFVPAASTIVGQAEYETMEEITIGSGPTEVAIRAITPGAIGNVPAGALLNFETPPAGVNGQVTVIGTWGLIGGADTESDEDLRTRILERIQKPPMGGDADDYVMWAKRLPAVTRAWAAPNEMGVGTCTVRIMCDVLRKTNDPMTDGFPLPEDLKIVKDYLDTVRPVTVKELYVLSPIPEPINFTLKLVNDSLSLRAECEASVADMLKHYAAPAHAESGVMQPAQTIYASWVSEAISRVTREFTLMMADHPMPNNGCLAVMGTVTYDLLPRVSAISPTSGPAAGGTAVNIGGANFSNVNAVFFGGVKSPSFTVFNLGAIVATSPPHAAGVVDVAVSSENGESPVSAADKFTYV